MPDKTERLHTMQGLLIDEFIRRIESGEATPSDLNAARQLLNDNGVHAQIKNDNPLLKLVENLPFEDVTDRAING